MSAIGAALPYATYDRCACGRPKKKSARRCQACVVTPLSERFWSKVAIGSANECWQWLAGSRTRDGYGGFARSKHVQSPAHRVAYELVRGAIPEGLVIDHLCRNTSCVNPSHLEPVTQRENVRRGNGPAGQHARQTSCVHGHPFDEANTSRKRNQYGHIRRGCRECDRLAHQRKRPAETS